MNRRQAKQLAMSLSPCETTLIYMETPHSQSRDIGKVDRHVKCGEVIAISGMVVRVKGYGPIYAFRQRAIVEPFYPEPGEPFCQV